MTATSITARMPRCSSDCCWRDPALAIPVLVFSDQIQNWPGANRLVDTKPMALSSWMQR